MFLFGVVCVIMTEYFKPEGNLSNCTLHEANPKAPVLPLGFNDRGLVEQ